MKIYSISKVLAFPIILIAVAILYFAQQSISVFIIIPVAMLVALYTFHGILDHWWLSRYPVPFDPRLRDWLNNHFKPYQQLHESDRSKFEYRMTLYIEGRLFSSVGSELRDVPEDIKCMVAAHGIEMCLGIDDYLIGDMDRIYLYKHPFPTPDFPFLHTVETNIEDGVIILSLEQLTNAVISPETHYNIGYHAYAEAFIGTQKGIIYPSVPDGFEEVNRISGFTRDTILQQTGFENIAILPIHITLFFSHPITYKEVLPEQFKAFSKIFYKNNHRL